MNLKSIKDTIWQELAAEAMTVRARGDGSGVRVAVDDLFYSHIYSKYSMDKVKYAPNLPGTVDEGWGEMIAEWKKIGKQGNLASALGDKSVGRAGLQIDIDNGVPDTKMARMWEIYHDGKTVSRFQFVVNAGGGMPLFNRMRRACQTYIHEKLKGDGGKSVIWGWKIFGEGAGVGRSDSCVAYLTASYKDAAVVDVVENYIWKHTNDLVDEQFEPLGFFRVGSKPFFALDLPDGNKEKRIVGADSGGSAGGYMGGILGKAFADAVITDGTSKAALVTKAKANAADIVSQLF